MIIDSYPHLYPQKYLKAVQNALPTPTVQFHLDNERFFDPDFRIRILKRFGVDFQIINVAGGLPLHETPSPSVKAVRESPRLATLANDEVANIVEKNSDYFAGAALLTLGDMNQALDELDRAVRNLGLKGTCIWTSDIPTAIGSRALDPFFEKMANYDLPILIHPSFGDYVRAPEDFAIGISLGWPFETAMAMARLVYGGVFERFPNIKFITHHSGSMIPYFSQRIKTFYDAVVDGSEATLDGLYYPTKLARNPIEYFRMFYNDTVLAGSVDSLKLSLGFFGSDHILLGTDYPYGPLKGNGAFKYTLDAIERAGMTEDQRRAVLTDNARKLFKLE